MKYRILIADDHQLFRDGLRALLEKEKDLEVVGEAQDGHEAVALVERLNPHAVMMDISMPGLNGIEATRRIKKESPEVRVIALSMHSDRGFVTEIFNAGASGYLVKDCDFEDVLRAVRTVLAGSTYVCPEIAGVVVQGCAQEAPSPESPLTAREREVLQLLAEGKSAKQIAVILKISSKTADTHRSHIMEKLNIHTIPELTKYAIREGITPLEK